ncbi:hypothetical protein Vretifemale_6729 [Volvox reticuliferus]|uniref:Calcineurin-like phosphoesterase domain-containing protein n=1 Tax=Volvox reticuliferus TaxID=1737510 RepID=A0A8J4C7R9_9CHLO|nr:hypothetical protein Vretifemale_6729 [Volvox reticuliferus]
MSHHIRETFSSNLRLLVLHAVAWRHLQSILPHAPPIHAPYRPLPLRSLSISPSHATSGYINFSALYIVWLCSAVFYHLPSLEQLGLDIRADVSMLIVAFMSSLAALSLLAGLHKAAVSLRLLPRRAYLPAIASARSGVSPGSGARGPAGYADSGLRELWILLLLNSMIIAVACSTYYSFCGNGTLVVGEGTPAFKVAVCAKWLHPILTADYPRFASWMLYGEGSAYTLAGGGAADAGAAADGGSSSTSVPQNGASGPAGFIFGSGYGNDTHGSAGGDGDGDGSSSGYISVDFPFDGDGMQSVPAGDVLSPVLCMWVTLVALYIATTLAGHPRLVQTAAMEMLPRTSTTGININQKRSKSSSAKIGGTGAGGGGASERGRRGGSRSETRSPPSASPSSSSLSGRRTASFRRAAPGGEGQGVGGTATGQAGAAGTAGAAATAAAGPTVAAGGSDGIRKSRHPSLDIKKPITKGLRKAAAAAASAARGVAASAALLAAGSAASGAAAAAARRSLSSLHGLAASTGRLKRAASDYLNTSHPYLPALLGQVRRSMAALEPHHLAAELAEATGLAPDLARALTRGSSFSALADAAAATLSSPLSPAVSFLNLGPASITAGAGRNAASVSGAPGARLSSYYTSIDAGAGGGGGGGRAAGGGGFLGVGAVSAAPTAVGPPPQPEFRDMVPWYSGTSADLFKTLFDLMVSVKLFLGRFDMRTMQAATAASMADSFNDTPNEGDGFTYEHLEERQQLWIDFIADTGDGGNPTYAVAAALAAPALTVAVSEDLPRTPPSAAAGEDGGNKNAGGRGRTAAEGGVPSPPRPGGSLVLPRGDVLLVGGDLAYPNPSRETYQQRLFTPFSYALPPPPHFHPGRLVVHKPDLPPAWGVQEAHLPCDLRGLSPRSSRRASSAALRRYMGPTAFAIPGNHDWIDGLETFTREIQHKGWLGGWLLPQEKSYFALRLPAGWWLFGFDLALVQDIDMQQYRYFANVVEQRMGPDDQVILMTHEPLWLLEWFWQRRHGTNLRQLVRGHLRGRARLHLAGDLHFYMRHTWNAAAPLEAEPPAPAPVLHGRGYSARGDADASVPEQAGSDDGSLCGLSSATASEDLQQLRGAAPIQPRAPAVAPPAADPASNTGGSSDRLLAGGSSDEALSGFSATASTSSLERSFNLRGNAPNPHSRPMQQQQAAAAPAGPGSRSNNDPALQGGSPAAPRSSQAPPLAHSKTQRRTEQQTAQSLPQPLRLNTSDPGMAETDGGGFAVRLTCLPSHARCAACEARQRWIRHPHDPQHLIVNGGGGAFLHPTHVFAGARFPAAHDPAADATAGLYAEVALPCTCGIYSPGTALYGGAPGGRIGPWLASGGWPLRPLGQPGGGGGTSTSSMTSFKDASRSVPAAMRASSCGAGGDSGISGFAAKGPEGEYLCAACYPSPRTSMHLGRRNLHVFRLRNTRFDVIGGVFYFLLVVSVLPRCSHLAEVLEADTPAKALSLLFTAYVDTLGAILGRSYLSAGALALLFLFTLGLAKGGGVGVTRSPLPSSSATSNGISIADGGAAMATTPSASPGTDSGVSSVCAPRPLLTARMGGFGGQLAFATAHCLTHVSLAIVLLLLLELGVETCIKFERLGADGPHSLYRWYRAYEEQHFPDPMGLRQSLQRWTMGLYPGVLQLAMSVYDVPELIAVARTAMCEAGGSLEPITRLQAVSYYAGMLSYYWLLATPAVGFVFGLYLYLSVCWCHVHYDEAFSSLREANCKSFCRLHIGPSGDLQLYTLALDEVPTRWQEDPRWWGPNGGGSPSVMAHEAHYPSRWVPVGSEVGQKQDGGAAAQRASATSVSARGGAAAAAAAAAVGTAPSTKWRLVDYVFVPRKQP